MPRTPSAFFLVFVLILFFTKTAEGSLLANYVYEIKSNEQTSAYIFGSNHQNYSEIPVSLGACAKSYLMLANEVVIEADQLANRKNVAMNISSPKMNEVINFLNDDNIKLIENKLSFSLNDKENKSKLGDIDAIKVVAWLNQLMEARITQFVGLPDYSLDAEVFLAARFLDKKISFLESPGEQLSYLRVISPASYAEQIKLLLRDIQDPKSPERRARQQKKITESAANGIEEDLIFTYKPESGSFEDQLLVRRNPNQARKISQLLDGPAKKPIFIALGALHLPGENGVPALLATKGYKVRRVCTQ
jgi:uncharacterized protein YbaP (TraB family)